MLADRAFDLRIADAADAWLNYCCTIALGRIGADAKQAIPHLEALRNSGKANLTMLGKPSTSNDTIGYAAAWAIDQINANTHSNHGTS